MAWRMWLGLGLLLVAGCRDEGEPRGGTGAEVAARSYYEAIIQKDWARAHAALHPDTRKRWGPEQFARLAQAYRKGLGFEPAGVKVRSCEEHGDEAVAHVVLTGRDAHRSRTFKDALALRRAESGWAVVLPPQFGEPR
jgi:hypothetical protein